MAQTLIRRHPQRTADRTYDEVLDEVREAHTAAIDFGLTDRSLTSRFIMLSVLRQRAFWDAPECQEVLTSVNGTPDARFEKLCGVMAIAARRTGRPEDVWW